MPARLRFCQEALGKNSLPSSCVELADQFLAAEGLRSCLHSGCQHTAAVLKSFPHGQHCHFETWIFVFFKAGLSTVPKLSLLQLARGNSPFKELIGLGQAHPQNLLF